MTKIENSDEKNYVFFSSDITHQPNILQKPDYVPSVVVDNTEYDATHIDRLTVIQI